MVALIVIAVVLVFALIAAFRTIRVIPQARAGVVERLGRYSRTLEPGLTLVVPFVDRVRPLVDLREQVVNFAPQSVITEDNVVVAIETVLYFTITDPRSATYEVANPLQAIEQLDRHDPAQRDRRPHAGGDADRAGERQHRAAHRPGRGDRQVGDTHQPRGDQVRGPAGGHPHGDGEADARRARPPRRDPHGRRREAGADPHGRGGQAGRRADGRGRAPGRDPARRGRSQGDRHGVHRDPRGQTRPRPAQLRIPADAPPARRRDGNTVFVVPSEFAQAFGGISEALKAARPGRHPQARHGRVGQPVAAARAPATAAHASTSARVRRPLRAAPGDAGGRSPARHPLRAGRRRRDARDPPRAAGGGRQLQGRAAVHRRAQGALPAGRGRRAAEPRPAGRQAGGRGADGADGRGRSGDGLRPQPADGDPDGRACRAPARRPPRPSSRGSCTSSTAPRWRWRRATCTGPRPSSSS